MKEGLKSLWRRIKHFWYPAVILCQGAEAYTNSITEKKPISMILGVVLMLCGLISFYEESVKLQKEEEKIEGDICD